MENFLIWILLGFFVSLFLRLTYAQSGSNKFSDSMFVGMVGAAGGDAMSKFISAAGSVTVSPIVYMLMGSIVLILWSLNNRIAH